MVRSWVESGPVQHLSFPGASLIGLVLLAACGSAPERAATTETPALVTVATVSASTDSDGLPATGTVRARRETVLSFNSPGRIASVLVDDGARVSAGQLLARLDPAAIDAGLVAAHTEAARTQSDLKRVRELFAKGWVARPRVEAAEAAASAAASQLSAAGFNQRYSRIVAPTAGVVLRRQAEPGQMVMAGTPVLTLGEAAGGQVLRAPMADTAVAQVRIGQTAMVSIPAVQPVPIAGRVIEVGGRGDERTGTFEVEIALPSLPGLRSGLIGEARIRTGGGNGRIGIPASAVWQARADEGFVYVVGADGRARSRLVGLGALNDSLVAVTSGLSAGERVVTAGIERIRDGGPVRIAAKP